MHLDIENSAQLIPYLRQTHRISISDVPKITMLTGGVANKTILVEHTNSAFVMKQALGKFRVSVDWFVQPQRSHLEVLGLQTYGQLCPSGSVPKFLFEDEANFIHAMSAIPQPHENYKTLLLRGQGSTELIQQYAALMAHVHKEAFAREIELRPMFDDLQYFESQRLEPFYAYTAQQVLEARTFIHALIEDTRRTQLTLVHADFTPKNILVYEGKLVLLDFEIVHWGDPAFDAGLALAHLLAKTAYIGTQDSLNHAQLFASDYVSAFVEHSLGVGLETRLIRHTLACLLARVRGKSQMDYLDEQQKSWITEWVVREMREVPSTVLKLCRKFSDLV